MTTQVSQQQQEPKTNLVESIFTSSSQNRKRKFSSIDQETENQNLNELLKQHKLQAGL